MAVNLTPETDTILLWVMLGLNCSFLFFRLWIRRRQHERLTVSDYLIILAFALISIGTSMITYLLCGIELQLPTWDTPKGNGDCQPQDVEKWDPVLCKAEEWQQNVYTQVTFSELFCNICALFATKGALLAFYYEIFPKDPRIMRKVLYFAMSYVAVAFLVNILATGFWCIPASTQWASNKVQQLCTTTLDPNYNRIRFSFHITSSVLCLMMPVLLLSRITVYRPSVPFAVTTFCFGLVSIGASCIAFWLIVRMQLDTIDGHKRRAAFAALFADQNAMFMAACLSVVRLRVRRKLGEITRKDSQEELAGASKSGASSGGLVIEVERTWQVEVDIVDSWGGQSSRELWGEPSDGLELIGGKASASVGMGGRCSSRGN